VLSKHPQPRAQQKKRTSVVATGSPKQSDLPCAMVYGLFRALPGDRAFLPPSLADYSANLTPASGRQDHTALPSALCLARLAKPKRPPHLAQRSWRWPTSLLSRRDGRSPRSDLPDEL